MLRKAEPKDVEAIGKIRVAAWQAAYREFMPGDFLAALDPKGNLAELRARISYPGPDFMVTVSEERGAVVAFSIVGAPRYQTAANTIELWAVNVLPEYWRGGVGSSLVEKAVKDARQLGFDRIELWCIKGNVSAQSAYEKIGFLKTGRVRSTSHLTGYRLNEVQYAKAL